MAIQPILKLGHPLLYKVSEPVKDISAPETQNIIKDMFDTMQAANGAGLAAPQIGYLQRIIIFGFDHNPRYPDEEPVPYTVLINPVISVLSNQMEEGWEGCLSVPGLRGLVPRHTEIRYEGYDQDGRKIEREVSGFHARVVQHEYDHIEGILYPLRIKDMKNFGFQDQLLI